MEESQKSTSYDVTFTDELLGIQDLRTVKASSEEEAKSLVKDEYENGRVEIENVEVAYELDESKFEELKE